MAVFNNLTAKELFSSIPSVAVVSQLMKLGLEQGSTQLAVSAMEELLARGDQNTIHQNLVWAIDNGTLKLGTSMSAILARSLLESHEANAFSRIIGKGLLKETPKEMEQVLVDSFEICYGKIPRSCERAIVERILDNYKDTVLKTSGSEEIARAAKFFT